MMRAALIVVGLGTLAVMELGTPSRTETSASDPFEQLTVDVSISHDTLEPADRLEAHHFQHNASVPRIEPTPPSNLAAIIPEEDSSAVGRGTNDKKDVVRKAKT
jgi:hypothetical protein